MQCCFLTHFLSVQCDVEGMDPEMNKIRREVEEFKTGKKSLLEAMEAITEILAPKRDAQ